jgi:hypothetical protein
MEAARSSKMLAAIYKIHSVTPRNIFIFTDVRTLDLTNNYFRENIESCWYSIVINVSYETIIRYNTNQNTFYNKQ